MHTNIWGLTHVQSFGISRYDVTFIDNVTRKTWVYALDRNMMRFRLLRSRNIWLRMRHGKY